MDKLTRLTGLVADVALGLPVTAAPYEVREGVAVPMPDGVTLLGDHYRPAGAGGPLPVVLVRLPYGRAGAFKQMFALPLARRGFQVFVQATRGTFGSGGQFRPFTTERDDGLATLAWLREQPWCDGRVAMTGGSYFGHTQWALAPYADPPLVCVSPHITSANVTDRLFYEHGVPQIHTALSWSAQIGRQEAPALLGALPDPRVRRRVRKALRQLPLQAADVQVAGAPVPFWRDFVGHAAPGDTFWEQADHDGADLSRMPPVSTVTGWWDLFLAGNLADFTALRAAGVEARLVVGPWLHGEPGELRAVAKTDAAWLDHHLNGGPAPEGARVRVKLQQTSKWLEFDEWPPPEARPRQLRLRKEGASSGFTYDPADPTPTVGGPLLQPPGKQADNREIEARDDVLVFTGPALSEPLDAVGPVRATIHVRTELPYADVFVRVCDVDEKGVSRNVTDGIQRLDPGHHTADEVRAVEVELFPTGYRFRPGHRVRVQVSGGAFPRYARNMGTGEPFGAATAGRTNRFEVFHDDAHPSSVEFTVI
ncbi:CocE/NonD family hydrolase [Symbioplanes lichenis]|uniref:CocE/NonD family hydrolase n=1 Tax=Symbioplanes lichenis TaxID=1629072 RepID=UPI00273A5096|nr:CocE/NonD family hydrolase [Actinoplanes lichenis]